MSDNFMLKKDWKNIHRGFIYEAVIPYHTDTKRPLKFFKPTDGKLEVGSIVREIGDFRKNNSSDIQHLEKSIIMNVKPRKCVILSSNIFNHTEKYDYVQIAPIQGIKPTDKVKPFYKDMLNEEHPTFIYLHKKITGSECYIDISDLQNIHKTMILEKKVELPVERMQLVEDLIVGWLDLGNLPNLVDLKQTK